MSATGSRRLTPRSDGHPIERRCTATNRAGNRCGKPAVMGARVCRLHGGAAPQVVKAARERLAELVEPAIEALRLAIQAGDTGSAVKAALGILDRCGMAPSREPVEVHVNVMQHPDWIALRSTIVAALEPHPEALAAVMEAVRRLDQSQRLQVGA